MVKGKYFLRDRWNSSGVQPYYYYFFVELHVYLYMVKQTQFLMATTCISMLY